MPSRTAARIADRCWCSMNAARRAISSASTTTGATIFAATSPALPSRRGRRGRGGMPKECRPETYGPRKLRLETLAGLVFGTLSAETPPLERYLGPEIVARIRRVMRAPVKILGGYSQTLPGNWKLYMENVQGTHHASPLHTVFTTFRLHPLSQHAGS